MKTVRAKPKCWAAAELPDVPFLFFNFSTVPTIRCRYRVGYFWTNQIKVENIFYLRNITSLVRIASAKYKRSVLCQLLVCHGLHEVGVLPVMPWTQSSLRPFDIMNTMHNEPRKGVFTGISNRFYEKCDPERTHMLAPVQTK